MSEHIIEIPDYTSPFDPVARAVSLGEEIVRCRDCKHMCEHDLSAYYGNHEYDQCSCCRLLDPGAISVEPDGFCSWGERREDEHE